MHDFHDQPSFNARREVNQLFTSLNASRNSKELQDFIPFNNERDKLGRLISRQKGNSLQFRHKSLQFNPKELLKRNPEGMINNKQTLKSDKTVEKLFRLNEVTNNKNCKDLNKLRILSSGNGQRIQVPSIGYYDIAQIMDRMKYRKSKKAAITQQKQKRKPQEMIKKAQHNLSKDNNYHNSSSQVSNNYKKSKNALISVELDYNLPELDRYHESKKLKMKIYDNFEEDHQKFKELVRHSLILANKIKKGLQLD